MLSYFLLTTVYLFTCMYVKLHVHTLIPLFVIFENAQSMATQTRVTSTPKTHTSIFYALDISDEINGACFWKRIRTKQI